MNWQADKAGKQASSRSLRREKKKEKNKKLIIARVHKD